MKGLILKDLYVLAGLYRKNLLMLLVLYGAIYLVCQMDIFLYMLIFMATFYFLSTFTLDNASQWDRYARTLPVSPRQIVAGKWCTAFLLTASSLVFSLALGAVGSLVHHTDYATLAVICLGVVVAALLLQAVLLPITFRWGPEWARNCTLLLFVILFCLVFLVLRMLPAGALADPAFLAGLDALLTSPGGLIALVVVILAVLAISFNICCHIYEEKEF